MAETLLRFVQISDTHINHDPHYNKDGATHTPLMGAKALVHQLKLLPFTPDFVLHTGDVAYDPVEDSYPAAREILSGIEAPVYYLAGNHDDAAFLQRGMLDSSDILTPFDYEFEVNGVQVVCMDSNRAAPDWKGAVSAEQLAWLAERTNAQDERPLIVALHHPVLEMGAEFWDEKMCLVDGEQFHQTLLTAKARLRGVFSGHVHQNTVVTRDGITYFTVLSSWYQMHNNLNGGIGEADRTANPGFNVVTVTRNQTYVRRHTFIVDPGSMME